MPEGDSVHKLASALTRAIVGKTVRAFSAHTVMDHVGRTVIGAKVVSATARGKNLLVAFDDGRSLHIHLRMLGRVRITTPTAPRRMPQLWIAFDDVAVMGWKIPVLRLLRKGAAERVPEIASLGPDLLAETFDETEALARFRANPDCEIGEALMLQRVVAGIGNVYKSEILFIERVNPRALVRDLDDDAILALVRRARTLLRMNVARRGPRVTRGLLGARHFVYERGGRACSRCRTAITVIRQANRSTYFCAKCQP